MNLPLLTFYVFAVLILGSAVAAITRRNAITAAVFLALSLMSVAGLYVSLHAEFLFAVQVMVYTGGIMVLFLFAIMLVNSDDLAVIRPSIRGWWLPAGFASFCFAVLGVSVAAGRVAPALPDGVDLTTLRSNTSAVGALLFTDYLLLFEMVSVFLLVAMIGAIVLAKKEAVMVPVTHYVVLSILLFAVGAIGVLVRRNAIIALMGLELMFNAANINLVVFSNSLHDLSGQVFAVLVIAIAAGEAAVGLAIVLAVFRSKRSIHLDDYTLMKG